jgi:hypothetical protein
MNFVYYLTILFYLINGINAYSNDHDDLKNIQINNGEDFTSMDTLFLILITLFHN